MSLWSRVKKFFSGGSTSPDLGGDAGTGFTSTKPAPSWFSPTTTTTSGGGGGGSSPSVSVTIIDSGSGASQLSTQESLKQDLQVATGDLTSIQKFEASKDLIRKVGVLEKIGLSKRESEVLAKREFIRREAIRRGKGFTRLEVERLLGGGKGVKSLRRATSRIRKARATGEIQEFLQDVPETISLGVLEPPVINISGLGIGDTSFFEDIKRIGEQIAEPFIETGREFYRGVSGFIPEKKREEIGKKGKEFIEEKEQDVLETIFPSKKEERLEQEDFENRFEDVENRIERFNEKYGGKELKESEYNKALKEQAKIENQINQLEAEQRTKQIKKDFEIQTADPSRFAFGVGIGLVSSPFELGKFGVGLATKPIATIGETIEGFAEIPTQLKADPFMASGELVGSLTGQSLILGGGVRGLRRTGRIPKTKIEFVKPVKIKKTPLSKTFADPDLIIKTRPSQLGLKRFEETRLMEEATQRYLQVADIDSALKRISRKPTPPKEPRLRALERVKEIERIERAREKTTVGRAMATEKALIENLKLEEAIRKAGLQKIPIEEPLPIHRKVIERATKRKMFEETKEKFLKDLDTGRVISEVMETLKKEPRIETLKRFRKKEAKKPKPIFEFDIDFSGLRNRLNRLRTGADRVVMDKDLNVRFQESEPRFKTPKKIRKLKKRAEKPSFEYKLAEEIPDEVKGEIKQTQRTGQQQVLERPQEATQKQIQKTEPPKEVVKILSEKELQKLRTKQNKLERQRQRKKQTQKQLERDDLLTRQVEVPRERLRVGGLVREKEMVRQKQLPRLLQLEKSLEKEMLKTDQIFMRPALSLKELQAIRQVEKPITRQILREIPRKLIVVRRTKKRKLKAIPVKAQGYDVFIKSKGRYHKITNQPVGLQEARNLRNWGIDKSTSRQGFIQPTKKYASLPSYNIPPSYAKDSDFKFRHFRQKKGKRIKLPKERVIERGRFLIDSRQEKQGLQFWKALAQRRKRQQPQRIMMNDFELPKTLVGRRPKKNKGKTRRTKSNKPAWDFP